MPRPAHLPPLLRPHLVSQPNGARAVPHLARRPASGASTPNRSAGSSPASPSSASPTGVHSGGVRKRSSKRRGKRLARVVVDKARRKYHIRSSTDLKSHLHEYLRSVVPADEGGHPSTVTGSAFAAHPPAAIFGGGSCTPSYSSSSAVYVASRAASREGSPSLAPHAGVDLDTSSWYSVGDSDAESDAEQDGADSDSPMAEAGAEAEPVPAAPASPMIGPANNGVVDPSALFAKPTSPPLVGANSDVTLRRASPLPTPPRDAQRGAASSVLPLPLDAASASSADSAEIAASLPAWAMSLDPTVLAASDPFALPAPHLSASPLSPEEEDLLHASVHRLTTSSLVPASSSSSPASDGHGIRWALPPPPPPPVSAMAAGLDMSAFGGVSLPPMPRSPTYDVCPALPAMHIPWDDAAAVLSASLASASTPAAIPSLAAGITLPLSPPEPRFPGEDAVVMEAASVVGGSAPYSGNELEPFLWIRQMLLASASSTSSADMARSPSSPPPSPPSASHAGDTACDGLGTNSFAVVAPSSSPPVGLSCGTPARSHDDDI
ncbi:hypothetical protein H9P43_000093 [Blastocladiella emersonii ATCC 22665]|nr:hypothetical protein H9P43_000093 [Blastocladiella emersonii ATCC 22665]